MTTPEPVPPPVADPPIGRSEFPLFHVFNRQSQGMLYARAVLEDRPYPLRAMLLFGSNPLVTTPDSARMAKALAKLELLVSVDPFLSATGAVSHYVLPAATFAESPTVDTNDVKVARVGVVTEQHESWHDWKILFRLARRLGLGAYFPWSNLHDALEARHVPYMRDEEHEVRSAPRAADAPLPRFPTPSGKVELESELLRRFGQDPLPTWKPPSAQPTPQFPLILVSGPRTRMYINSQFRQIPSLAQKQREPVVELHPDTAKARGLADGDLVRLISPRGQVQLRLRVADRVHPEAALVPSGWAKANANFLTSDGSLDPISGFPAFRSGVCRVEKA
jgi:anaerobic selenocysteine-containing dehydrogenase